VHFCIITTEPKPCTIPHSCSWGESLVEPKFRPIEELIEVYKKTVLTDGMEDETEKINGTGSGDPARVCNPK